MKRNRGLIFILIPLGALLWCIAGWTMVHSLDDHTLQANWDGDELVVSWTGNTGLVMFDNGNGAVILSGDANGSARLRSVGNQDAKYKPTTGSRVWFSDRQDISRDTKRKVYTPVWRG